MSFASIDVQMAPHAPFLLSADEALTRGDVGRWIDALSTQIRTAGLTRVVTHTPHSGTIVAALGAGEACNVPVVLTHPTLSQDQVRALCLDWGVQAFVEDALRLVPVASDRRATDEGFSVSLMTSGTTGQPKLVRHDFDNLLARTRSAPSPDVPTDHRWLLTYQPTTFAGLQVILTAVCSQAALVVPAGRTPGEFFEATERFGVTHISGTPTFWRAFLLASMGRSLPRLQQITLGGEAVDQPTLDRLASRFPDARITHVYASTEAGSLFAVHDRRAGFPEAWLATTAAGVSLRIRNGVLEVRSPRRMVGYVGESRPAVTDDGWLMTGDLVRVDGERVYFQGRTDAVINVGGGKVYPQEIEEFLLSCAGVTEARVRGVSNPLSGTILAADVVLDASDDPTLRRLELMRLCQASFPPHKAPRLIRVVREIATHDSGKKA